MSEPLKVNVELAAALASASGEGEASAAAPSPTEALASMEGDPGVDFPVVPGVAPVSAHPAHKTRTVATVAKRRDITTAALLSPRRLRPRRGWSPDHRPPTCQTGQAG